jgi:hypothetical protein
MTTVRRDCALSLSSFALRSGEHLKRIALQERLVHRIERAVRARCRNPTRPARLVDTLRATGAIGVR